MKYILLYCSALSLCLLFIYLQQQSAHYCANEFTSEQYLRAPATTTTLFFHSLSAFPCEVVFDNKNEMQMKRDWQREKSARAFLRRLFCALTIRFAQPKLGYNETRAKKLRTYYFLSEDCIYALLALHQLVLICLDLYMRAEC